MIRRAIPATLLTAFLVGSPAAASQPEGLAAKLITDLGDRLPLDCEPFSFQWYESFDSRDLAPSETVTVEMAIVTFSTGVTFVGLDDFFGQTFFGIEFSNGLVNGIPYNRFGWNSVIVELRPASQDYMLSVNGVQRGPFPFAEFCPDQGGCFTVQALRLHGLSNDVGSVAWVDTVSISRESSTGQELFHEVTFDACLLRPLVNGGVILIGEPERLGRGRCRGAARDPVDLAN